MTVVLADSRSGRPTPQTTQANATARPKLKSGPAKATMILSQAEIGGSSLLGLSLFPSIVSIGAICGSETYPPAGIQPRTYSTPLISFFQIALPHQIEN